MPRSFGRWLVLRRPRMTQWLAERLYQENLGLNTHLPWFLSHSCKPSLRMGTPRLHRMPCLGITSWKKGSLNNGQHAFRAFLFDVDQCWYGFCEDILSHAIMVQGHLETCHLRDTKKGNDWFQNQSLPTSIACVSNHAK